MRKASWILLTVLGGLMLLGSIASTNVAYVAPDAQDGILGKPAPSMADMRAWNPEIATAMRARRGTAAAWAGSFAVLWLIVVTGPYRRGEVWAWWALLAPVLVLFAISALRIPTLGTQQGALVPSGIVLGVTILGLLLDVGRLKKAAA